MSTTNLQRVCGGTVQLFFRSPLRLGIFLFFLFWISTFVAFGIYVPTSHLYIILVVGTVYIVIYGIYGIRGIRTYRSISTCSLLVVGFLALGSRLLPLYKTRTYKEPIKEHLLLFIFFVVCLLINVFFNLYQKR